MRGNKKSVIGGDFNANVVRNQFREGVCGRYGLEVSNEAGRDLINWCSQFGLAYANSYHRHARRGTWLHPVMGSFHELDKFLVRSGERAGLTRTMRTIK